LETGRFVEKVGVGSVADVSECTHCIVGFDAVSLLDGLTRAFGKSVDVGRSVVSVVWTAINRGFRLLEPFWLLKFRVKVCVCF
jgi:hypothetical protein